MHYDQSCETLAAEFLRDDKSHTQARAKALAEVIQAAVEEWLEENSLQDEES